MITRAGLNKAYFIWLRGVVFENSHWRNYRRLLRKLFDTEFVFSIAEDGNRADDGVELRYRFCREKGVPQAAAAAELDDRPCSVLEMMAALAIRCEGHIMSDPEYGNRTDVWFFAMIRSLGLSEMTDELFDEDRVEAALTRMMDRAYRPNGRGGLFTVQNPKRDLRSVEIWMQMCWYLDEILSEKGRSI